jgi:hypothetical protein
VEGKSKANKDKKMMYIATIKRSESDPTTFKHAIRAFDAEHWIDAVSDETNQLNVLDAWVTCDFTLRPEAHWRALGFQTQIGRPPSSWPIC